jgi:hypothetical protein
MRYAALVPACAAVLLAGCTEPQHVNAQIGDTPALLTSADLRIVTDRPPPLPGGSPGRRAVCTEPSPDVAKALSTALSLSASANVSSTASGQGALDSQTVEQAMELAGRVPGVIALRDSTYRLCEAWANGAIGDSAYALALGRYGELLVTLMLGEDMIASTRPAPVTLTASLNPSGGSGTTPAPKAAGAAATQTAKANPAAADVPVRLASLSGGPLLITATDAATVTTVQPATPPVTPSATPTAPATPVAGKPASPATSTTSVTTASDPTAVAQALEEMQKNYLTLGATGPVIAACIASADDTTPARVGRGGSSNEMLSSRFCQSLLQGYLAGLPRPAAASTPVRRVAAVH